MTDLDKLIEAVETGEAVKWADFVPHIGIVNARLAGQANCGSLDAAKALHEALLPGWHYWMGFTTGAPTMMASVWPEVAEWDGIDASNPTPARAWLLSILKAYRSTQG